MVVFQLAQEGEELFSADCPVPSVGMKIGRCHLDNDGQHGSRYRVIEVHLRVSTYDKGKTQWTYYVNVEPYAGG